MKVLVKKLFTVAGLWTFMTILIGSGISHAVPLCYMVDQGGQTVDLSYMCNQNTPRSQPQETQEEGRTFSRRVPVNEPTSQKPIRTYTDVYKYVNSQENQDNSWNDFQYYNRFLEYPSTNVTMTATRQEISPRVVRYSREVLVNPDGSEVVITNRNSSRISRQRVIGPYGLPESVFVDYSKVPSGSFSPLYRPIPREQVGTNINSLGTGSSSNVLTNFFR